MSKVVKLQLGEYRPVYFYDLNGVECERGDYVIMEVERGSEFGKVLSKIDRLPERSNESVKGKVLRKATEGDLKQIENNRMKAKDTLSTCIRKITDRKLDMQIVKAEYTFDSSKIIFSFTADGRIDFRHLVKDLARVFRVRIELKQIGVRDKAKIVSGFGVCGREFCCSSYMNSFHPLSIKMAKEQGLPLNPSRISGSCGRIKCCMAYEFNVYRESAKNLPRINEKIDTPEGKGKIIDVNILKRIVYIDVGEGQIIKKVYPQKEGKQKENER
ncbi:MAG: stage 0 sporulation protein [Candidatus Omnitrophica bacterium]|nr:stage 0 sporulation protein [Candidatus Omnitrophota bacterium]MBU1997785.1 stage 0 sporulation protein [Candidatus Omnitrophota bacterium]MBU4333678.1 stage 0 sporulation protein [Candidatus Omnitrophota bacterium]